MIKEVPFKQNEFNSLTEFALSGIDFRPIVVGYDDDSDFLPCEDPNDLYIHSGSIREIDVYCPALNQFIHATEIFAIGSKGPDGTKWSEHRLLVEYDDQEDEDELCLDRGIFLITKDERETFDKSAATDRIMKALGAIAERRIELG